MVEKFIKKKFANSCQLWPLQNFVWLKKNRQQKKKKISEKEQNNQLYLESRSNCNIKLKMLLQVAKL